MFRVGIDTGGTFTDCVVLDEAGGFHQFKSPSTPDDFSLGVLDALNEAAAGLGLEQGEFLAATETIIHGTTVATNALVTRNVAPTALITTRGFRDIIEMRRSLKIETRSMYEAFIPPYEPIVPRRLRFTVKERTSHDGRVTVALDEDELGSVIEQIKREKVQAVAICLINSYANPQNEKRAAAICEARLGPQIYVTHSCEILPKLGEYERESSCVISACLGPIVSDYMGALERRLEAGGFAGRLLIMQANQYVQSVSAVIRKPAYLMGSGPAAAPAGAAFLGGVIAEPDLITADMGGTTFDGGLLTGGRVSLAPGRWLGDDRLGLKAVEVSSIGSGGGSIGWIDPLGLLKVGPQSAGSDPGPACYAKGGTEPTVTDAAVILGYIPADYFWGGKLALDVDLARAALGKVAEPLGMSIEQAAWAMFRLVTSDMADGTAEITTRRGFDARDYSLLAMGGGGALCGAFIAERLGMEKTIIPRFSASFSAWSMFSLDLGRDYLRSYPTLLKAADLDQVNRLYAEMEEEALGEFGTLEANRGEVVISKSADIRYRGQYHELEVDLPGGEITASDLQAAEREFHARHRELFTFDLPKVPLLLRNLRLIAKLPRPKPDLPRLHAGGADAGAALKRRRPCYFDGAFEETPVYDGAKLKAGNILAGPALIEAPESTLVVPPGAVCRVDPFGNHVITSGNAS